MEKDLQIGNMIKYFLSKNNMTMKQLGEKLGRSESNVSKWIKGTSTPQAKELSKMTYIFETDINTLMFGEKKEDLLVETINLLRELDDERKEIVLNFVKFQLAEQKNSTK